MLVLSRKPNEHIHIGQDVRITVLELRPDKVRIGINAPREVPVHRHEVFADIVAGEGKWLCSCGAINTTPNCRNCGTKKG